MGKLKEFYPIQDISEAQVVAEEIIKQINISAGNYFENKVEEMFLNSIILYLCTKSEKQEVSIKEIKELLTKENEKIDTDEDESPYDYLFRKIDEENTKPTKISKIVDEEYPGVSIPLAHAIYGVYKMSAGKKAKTIPILILEKMKNYG